jgi:hypothetical protein
MKKLGLGNDAVEGREGRENGGGSHLGDVPSGKSFEGDWGRSMTMDGVGHSAGEQRIGVCPKRKKSLRDISDGRRQEKRDRKRRGERPRGAI